MTDVTAASLAELVAGRLIGDGARRIVGLGDLRTAGPEQIGFVRHKRYRDAAAASKAGALLLAEELPTKASQILVDDVDVAYAKVALLFHPLPRATEHMVHPTAVVDPEAELEAPVQIGPRAVVGRARIGSGTVVMAGVVVGDDVTIGGDCVFYPNATIYPNVRIGNRVIVHANAVIGADGFGYAHEDGHWLKVPQLGTTVLEDDVEIGSLSTVDRATLGVTLVRAGSKIDNLCHIAHNCSIGYDVVMAGGAMVAGSTTIGDRCSIAGQVGITGHIKITDDVRLGGGTVVLRDIDKPGDYMGHPVLEKRRFMRLLRKLRDMVVDADE
jgi:UDP-3-O-[3-hydroxymyristoyl] glucosamine N-acyltransferase